MHMILLLANSYPFLKTYCKNPLLKEATVDFIRQSSLLLGLS